MIEVARILSDFVVKTDFEQIPPEVVRKATHCFLDLLGVTLAGSAQPLADTILKLVQGQDCAPRSTVVGRGVKTSPLWAAFANATIGHVLEYDDIKTGIGHPSITIIPPVLALAEERGSGGKDVLTAFITGFEVSSKIAKGVEPELSMNGWHTTSAVGIFGAAAAAARLLRLNTERIRNCLGIAATFACGLVGNFGTAVKPVHAGEAAERGLKAALLAEMGMTANQEVFGGKWGFGNVFAGKYSEEAMIENLGAPFEVLANGFKFYPCCASTHTAIDAVLDLLQKRRLNDDDVDKVQVGTVPVNIDNLKYASPADPVEARFSMQFCVATALIKKQVTLEDFTREWIYDPRMQRLMPKISMFLHPALAHLGYVGTENSIVSITMKGGRKYETRVDIPRGHPHNPLSEKELMWKYSRCAASVISESAAAVAADMILNMQKLGNVQELMARLCPNG